MLEHKDWWSVRFLNWKSYSNAVLTQKGSAWNILSNANLLVGGVNFTNDFL